MSRFSFAVVVILMAVLYHSPAFAEKYYKYIDKDGGAHFVERKDQVPQEYRDQIENVNSELSRYHSLIRGLDATMYIQARADVDKYDHFSDMLWQMLVRHNILYIFAAELLGLVFVIFWVTVSFSRLPGCLVRWAARVGVIFFYFVGLGLFNNFVLHHYFNEMKLDMRIHIMVMEERGGWSDSETKIIKDLGQLLEQDMQRRNR